MTIQSVEVNFGGNPFWSNIPYNINFSVLNIQFWRRTTKRWTLIFWSRTFTSYRTILRASLTSGSHSSLTGTRPALFVCILISNIVCILILLLEKHTRNVEDGCWELLVQRCSCFPVFNLCVSMYMRPDVYASRYLCVPMFMPPDVYASRYLCIPMFMGPHVYAFPCLCLPIFMPPHIYASPCLCLPMFMPPHVYISSCLCLPIFMPPHVYASPCCPTHHWWSFKLFNFSSNIRMYVL